MLSFVILFGLPLVSYAGSPSLSENSRFIQYVQQKYASQSEYPILIFDRDEIEWRFAKTKAFKKNEKALRLKIIQQYVREKTGFEATDNDADNFESYLTVLKDGANALPVLENGATGAVRFCAIFPADANSNRRLGAERVLQLQTPGLYKTDFSQILEPMSHEQLRKISLYHELSHCLDTRFFPESYNSGGDADASQVHRNEAFAETLAILLLAKEGMGDLGKTRSAYRSVYARVVGNFLARREGGMDPNQQYGGPIYYLSPMIKAAQAMIEASPDFFHEASLASLKKIAEEIVLEQSFSFQMISLIRFSYTDGRAAAFERSTKFEQDFPDLFKNTTKNLLDFYRQTDAVLETFFTRPNAQLASPALMPFKPLELCSAFTSGSSSAYFARLDAYRNDLLRENGTPEEQRDRARSLMNVFETSADQCFSENAPNSGSPRKSKQDAALPASLCLDPLR